MRNLSFIAVDPGAFRVAGVNLARTVDFAHRVVVHFLPVGNPAGEATDSEHHGKHVRGDAHGAVENAGVEVHVRVKFALDEVFVLEGGVFEFQGDVQERVVNVFAFEYLVHEFLQDLGARVVTLVHAVAESGKAERVVLVLGLGHHLFNRHAALLDAQKRFEHGLVGATMERTPQGADAGANACVKVGLRTAHHTHGRSGAVLFMVGVNNQERVQGLFHDRIRVVRTSLAAEHHVQEVTAVTAFGFRVHERFADACLVREGGDGANLGNKACGREFECARDVFVVVEARGEKTHGVHHGTENAHGVRSRRHFPKEVQQVFVQQGVFGQKCAEMAELFLVWKFTVNQEPCRFGEGSLFGQVFDGVTSVAENTMFAIHIRDGTLGATGIQVAVVERYEAGILAEFAHVKAVLMFGTLNDGEFVTLSVVIQGCNIGH